MVYIIKNNVEIYDRMKCVMSMDERFGIGAFNRLPWSIPSDLARFKNLTKNATIVMGSKTFFSLPINRRPLPGEYRISIVLTRNPSDSKFDPYRSCRNLHIVRPGELVRDPNMIVIGGSEVFDLLSNDIDTMHLTVVRSTYACDTFLNFDWRHWNTVEVQEWNDHVYYVLERKRPGERDETQIGSKLDVEMHKTKLTKLI